MSRELKHIEYTNKYADYYLTNSNKRTSRKNYAEDSDSETDDESHLTIRATLNRIKKEYQTPCILTGWKHSEQCHVKPQDNCTYNEKIDIHNMFYLEPTLHKAFDTHLFTITTDKKIQVLDTSIERLMMFHNKDLSSILHHVDVQYLEFRQNAAYNKWL